MGLPEPTLKLPPDFGDLVYVPTLPATHRYWTARSDYKLLTPEIAVPWGLVSKAKDWQLEWLRGAAAALACRSAVVTGRHAARLWGIGVHGTSSTGVVDLILPGDKRPKSPKLWGENVRYLSTNLPEGDIHVEDGLRLTTPWRAVRDIALRESELSAVVAIDSLRFTLDGSDRENLARILGEERYHGRSRVKTLLALSNPRSESPLETWGREQLRLANEPEITAVQLQAPVRVPGGSYRVDMLINGWLIVEFDGKVKYQDDPEGLSKEADRQHRLLNNGHPIIRVSYQNLARGEFVGMVLTALRKYPRRTA